MSSGSGIAELMAAENRASQIVAEARIARGDRMKQAQADADALITTYRSERQEIFDDATSKLTSNDVAGQKLRSDTTRDINDMSGLFTKNAQVAVDVLLDKCTEVNLDVPAARIRSTQKLYGGQ